ncbi:MAG TPA: hypothetical protein VGN12_12035 [Pirellulales bacterium]|jgi:hypothetical protein
MAMKLQEVNPATLKRTHQLRKSIPKEEGTAAIESVKANGLLHLPYIDSQGELIAGDVLAWAAQKAGEEVIPVLVDETAITEEEALRAQLGEDAQYIPLKVTDRARGFERLMELRSCTATEVAVYVQTSDADVTRHRSILTLEQPFQDLADSGKLGISKLYELSLMSSEERTALLPQLRNGELTRADIVAARKPASGPKDIDSSASPKRLTAVLAGSRSVTVQADELDLDAFIETVREVLKRAQRAQARGVDLQGFVRALRAETKAAKV